VIKATLFAAAALVLVACGPGSGGEGPCAMLASCGTTGSAPLVVFAAASLQPPFDRIATQLKSRYNVETTFNYAGSQTLTAQLTQGAQADVFASADTAHMKTVRDANLVAGEPRLFAHNRLEIAVEKGNPKGIHTLADLAKPGIVVVLADPSVPAGKYAQQALAKAGVTVKPASLETQVTGVLTKVALGEADAGIVYVSDVVTSGQVDGVAIADAQNVIADYPIAAIANAQHKGSAQDFIDFVLSPAGQAILKAAGFEGV
jgi:molybdate transport system substrate-binding protein